MVKLKLDKNSDFNYPSIKKEKLHNKKVSDGKL